MKLLLLLFTFTLASCSSYKAYNHISQKENNLFIKNSILRSTPKQISLSTGKDKELMKSLYKCYTDKNSDKLMEKLNNLKTVENHFPIWNALSNCNQHIGKYNLSRHYLRLAMGSIKNKKDKANLLNNYSILLIETNNKIEALNTINESISQYQTPLALYNKSLILLRSNKFASASSILKNLNRANKNDIDVVANLAYSLIQLNNHKEVVKLLSTTNKIYIKRADINIFYSFSLYQEGRYSEALDVIGLSSPEKKDEKDFLSNLESVIEKQIKLQKKSSKT